MIKKNKINGKTFRQVQSIGKILFISNKPQFRVYQFITYGSYGFPMVSAVSQISAGHIINDRYKNKRYENQQTTKIYNT